MITSKQLKEIKEYHVSKQLKFLCHSAEELGMLDEFSDYLMANLDGTTMFRGCMITKAPRWFDHDQEGRIKWLDKHIKLLEGDNK